MEEEMDTTNAIDEEEQERKLLADTSEEDDEKSDDDDDDDDDDAVNEQNEAEIRRIKDILAANPYEYEAHKSLIEKLQKMGDLDRLRLAREDMSSKFPLTPEIWLSWLKDEMKLALTQEEKNAVLELCERAVNDYLSVEVWFEYLQFCTGLGTEKETIEKIRNLFERALTAVGLHVMKGDLIWETYREFENFILNMVDSNELEQQNQINRIGKLFRRQLACPLFGIEKTFEEYELWKSAEGASCSEDEKTIKMGYERALLQLNERIPFEEKLESAQNQAEQFDIYKAYLLKEKQIGDPARVTVLYERAITDACLESTLWLDYLDYLENHLKIDDIIEKAYARVVKNVPWCSKIWQNWMRFYEKKNKPLSELQKLIENALAVGFAAEEYKNVWLTYLEYLRRKLDDRSENEEKQLEILRKNFVTACEHVETFEGDPTCEIKQFWARTEAIHGNNMEEARRLWAEIMTLKCHSESAASWLEYISLERCYGDTKKLRKLFQKALTHVKDYPEIITNAWINFERDEGTLEQMEICEKRTKERLEKVAEERKKSQTNPPKQEGISMNRKSGKRKMEDDGRWKNLGPPSAKKPLLKESALNLEKNKKPVETAMDLQKSKIAPPPGYQEAQNSEKMEEESHETHKVDDKITVFVSNLDYSATEDQIQEVLSPVGPITLIRLVKDYKNRSKGFGYVQLSSPDAVEEALKLDRVRVNGRPMFISRCDPNKTSKGPNFKYKTELEKNKLFVKGLNPITTKEKLEEIFKVYGDLKDVRIVTYRNGHSKGLAYVEFENEESATKALVATDEMTVDEKVISVEKSQPPQRKQEPNEHSEIKSLGGTSTSRSHFGNPKTSLMVPRSLLRNTTNSSDSQRGTANKTPVSDNGTSQPLSNQDFRNMLLKK